VTIHYHGTPISPNETLLTLSGRHFCVSFARPDQTKLVHQMGQSIMHDCGAYSVWKKTKEPRYDWNPYYAWVEPLLYSAAHWAIIPDEIDSGTQAQDYLVSQWPFGQRGSPVWHMDEPIERLLRLCDAWPKVCIGSTDEYRVVGSPNWRRRIDEAFTALVPRHRFLPWLHMLRGMQTVKWGYPFTSVDSTDIGQNHHRKKSSDGARQMLDRWDAMQCPRQWERDKCLDTSSIVKPTASSTS
jgi:hypothetical protein